VNELHHQKPGPVVGRTDVVNVHDAGVLEGGYGARLAHQSFAGNPVTNRGGMQQLDRHRAAKALVEGAEDDTHPARAKLLGEHVTIGDAPAAHRLK
jgi:hypothetical protein